MVWPVPLVLTRAAMPAHRTHSICVLSLALAAVVTCGEVSIGFLVTSAAAQEVNPPAADETTDEGETDDETPEVTQQVDVEPVAADDKIASRLTGILEATEYYEEPRVEVREGVVFLQGRARTEEQRRWAGELAARTEAVVAVVNKISVIEPPLLDFDPALQEMRSLGRTVVRHAPLALLAVVALVCSYFVSRGAASASRRLSKPRLQNPLLQQVFARTVGIVVFLIGVYLALRISGLTRLAVTVLGGTGILGLVLGFAFRDIAENFLASILISMQRPFATGDLIRIGGMEGFVQSVNTRSTILMTLEGSVLQIPNATIYKETITNLTANRRSRLDFEVGIGFDNAISEAQATIMQVLKAHEAVLNDPEPLVLVEAIGSATIKLRVHFWADIVRYSNLRVKSAVIRHTVVALMKAGISMPDEAREIVFPNGVPVRMLAELQGPEPTANLPPPTERAASDTETATEAEGDLSNEAADIARQAETTRKVEGQVNLI